MIKYSNSRGPSSGSQMSNKPRQMLPTIYDIHTSKVLGEIDLQYHGQRIKWMFAHNKVNFVVKSTMIGILGMAINLQFDLGQLCNWVKSHYSQLKHGDNDDNFIRFY